MSISSEITRITNNVQNTIDTIEATGVTVPEGANSDNLPSLAAALANEKQDKLTGTQGQVVGFDEDGNAVPQAAGVTSFNGRTGAVTPQTGDYTAEMVGARPSTWTPSAADVGAIPNPSGGTTGQILEKTETGTQWADKPASGMSQSEADARYLQLSGGTMTGALTLNGNPSAGNQAANKAYVDSKAPKYVSVTLSSSGWASNSQTVTVQGVKTSGQSVRISPATKTDADNWVTAGVWCSEPTTANQLVFTCDTAPTENININVELQEVQS